MLKSGRQYQAYIMTVIANPEYVKGDTGKLANNTYRKHDADFSGVVNLLYTKRRYAGGYTYENGQLLTKFNQHTEMANNYIATMSKDLQTMFPNISTTDADALSWGGLGDTQAWRDMLNNDPTKANNIINY